MSANTLTANSISSTYLQILHIGTGSAGACTVRTGDGTATVLDFVSGGAKINGTLEVTGDVTIKGVPVSLHVTADVVATTTTQVAIPQFYFVPVVGATYQIEMWIIAASAATTTGVQIVNSSGSGTLILTEAGSYFGIASIGGTYTAIAAPVASGAFGIMLYGVFTADSAAPLAFNLKSEVAASAVVIKAGSVLKITRIA